MHEAAITEFPFVESLPKREKSKLARMWDHFQAVRAAAKEYGALLPQYYAADLLGVSRQRVHVLVNEGRLQSVEIAGLRYVTESSLMEWAKSERQKGGRPVVAAPGVRQIFRQARESVLDSASKIK